MKRDNKGRFTSFRKVVRKITNWLVFGMIIYLIALIGKDFLTGNFENLIASSYASVKVQANKEMEIDYEDLADRIFQLESSSGRNDGCKREGLVNGYGYRQNSRSRKCYDNQTEVRNIVIGWFKKHLESGMDLATTVCYYNTGYKINTCNYYNNYININLAKLK